MKITFLGATKTVTGSNFLVEAGGSKFLVDCGMWQGKAEQEMENEQDFEFDPSKIDFMLLTHAHIDHSGRIPKLYNEGFKGKIYTHKATKDLCSIMLPDSGHIQEAENQWKNKKRIRNGKEPVPPLYTAEDAIDSLELFESLEYNKVYEITDNISIRLNDAGHMLGSAIIEVWEKTKDDVEKAVFTGDLGNNDIPLLDNCAMIEDADYLVMESTYGSRRHLRNNEKANLFLDIVSKTLEQNGTVVIPSFAVGRTQEILYELNKLKEKNLNNEEFLTKYKELMKANVYVDSPLATSATNVFKENMNLFSEEIRDEILRGDNPLEFPGLQFTQSVDESKALNESNEPSIIISASGMCEVGRIKHHLKHHIWNPNSTILFVGFQAAGTLGHSIVNGAKKVKIFGEEIQVNAKIEYIEGYSGHADQEGLLNFVYSFYKRPKCIFLVHGEDDSQIVLKQELEKQLDTNILIPDFGDTYELDKNTKEVAKLISKIERKISPNLKDEVIKKVASIKEEIKDMEIAVLEDLDNKQLTNRDIYRINEKIKDLEKQILNVIEG